MEQVWQNCFAFAGKVRSLFVILSDDQFRKILGKFPKSKPKATTQKPPDSAEAADTQDTQEETSPSELFEPSRSKSRNKLKRGAQSGTSEPAAKK